MLQTVGQVVRALKSYREYYHPKSSGILMGVISRTTDVDADPFRRGFLDSLELRTELLRRLSALDERERAVLMLWYVMDQPVHEICDSLSLSRSHCYRVRDRALANMTDQVAALEVQEAFA
jgi:DNA-directed RNA polymerase specialized sigma subunit